MAQVVNDTDKLTYILTDYGLQRVTEALADPTVYILLTKIKVGDANFEYYTPQEAATELVHPIENGEFPLVSKELLEDGLTVSLHAIFPESLDNCEIREVGIYETVNGEDKLFALSTQQPQLKPAESLGYLTVVEYYAFLRAQNLSDIYDQILLDPDTQLVTREELDKLISTVAFTESNLMEQINGNSRVIGLNRAEQLRKEIEKDRNDFSYTSAYDNYSILLNFVNPEDIFGYWLFNYPRRSAYTSSVTDISLNNRNLSTNKPINAYDRVFEGIMSSLSFGAPNCFYLDQNDSISKYNPNSFETIGTPTINNAGIARDFTASDYVRGLDLVRSQGDTVGIFFDFALENNLDDYNIISTNNSYTFLCYFEHSTTEGEVGNIIVKLGDGTQWVGTVTYTVPAIQSYYNIRILFNNTTMSLGVLINNTYVEKSTVTLTSSPATTFGTLNIGVGSLSYEPLLGSIDLKGISVNINGSQVFSGSISTKENDMSFVTEDLTSDIPFTMIFAVDPLSNNTDRTLLARSSYATNSNIFEVIETTDRRLQIRLFSDSSNYLTFHSGVDTVPVSKHSVVFSYDPDNKSISAFIGGKKVNMIRTQTGVYTHMNTTPSTLYAFTYIQDGNIWADSSVSPTTLYNEDGTPYTGESWSIEANSVFFGNFLASYNQSGNITTDTLYAWNYNDGLDDHTIYTKDSTLLSTSTLYENDYTVYTGEAFKLVQSGTDYIIQYNTHTTDYTPGMNIPPRTLYNYFYAGDLQTIWANDSAIPSALYESNGNLYTGTDWRIVNNTVYYKTHLGVYNNLFNILVPAIPVTSYLIQLDGTYTNYINSNIGVISVIKNKVTDEKLRSFALNLEATMGNNPCISIS